MEWISVSERLPEDMQEVMFSNTGIKNMIGESVPARVVTGYYLFGGIFRSWVSMDNMTATHWMPLPEPPVK
jgi:hypothetical protein